MDIKTRIRLLGIPQWRIAERVGVNEFTLSRWLRRPEELDAERLTKVEKALKDLVRERDEKLAK